MAVTAATAGTRMGRKTNETLSMSGMECDHTGARQQEGTKVMRRSNLRHYLQQIMAMFLVAVAVNYVWELAQAPLYAGWTGWDNIWWHCFVASLGDGILVWIIFATGWAVFRRFDWIADPDARAIGVMLAAGLGIALAIEWLAVHILERWTYGPRMPVIPVIGIGLVPVLQMLLLPPLIFRIVAGWSGRKHARDRERRIAGQ